LNTVEPPILIARLLTFVFAAALGVVITMIITVSEIMPLNKTQVFFLTTTPKENTEISLQAYYPNDINIEIFKKNFIKEYIKTRNEITANATVMHKKWNGTGPVAL